MKGVLAPVEQAAKRILRYHQHLASHRETLVGYVMDLGYDAGVIVTNDYYKIRVGGLSKNSFLLIVPGSLKNLIRPDDDDDGADAEELFQQLTKQGFRDVPPHLILARVLEPAATPLSQDVARTYFEMHKAHMPEMDVFTRSELQWGAMKIAVLGTFYDSGKSSNVVFGGDIQSFLSPHLYSVHVPGAKMLEDLINVFVNAETKKQIGHVRLTESVLLNPTTDINVYVSPADFIGARTALFGKTRMGKSNTVKVIAQMILDSKAKVGQVIFDLNGEYAYRNEQDNTSIYDLYRDRCVRYSLRPTPPPGVRLLKADFYGDLGLGHRIIKELFTQQEGKPPDYMKAFFEWEVLSADDLDVLRKEGDDGARAAVRYQRQESIYRCILHEAKYEHANTARVKLHLNEKVRQRLGQELTDLADSGGAVPEVLSLGDAAAVYSKLWQIYDPAQPPFASKSGRDYLDDTAKSMLTILTKRAQGSSGVYSGYSKLIPYRRYHSKDGGKLIDEITKAVDERKTVIIDLSNAAEELVEFFGDMVCSAIFNSQMEKFTSDKLGDQFVQFYFEEAHNLFPSDDKNLRNIYNRLAKEGAKLNIGIIYSTQSIESLSPDLLKNTENFFIAHLNDDREIRALTRFHEFRDVGADVQRSKSQGFVRMITRSHRFALPVQVRKFGPEA